MPINRQMLKRSGRKPLDGVQSARWGEKMSKLTDMQRLFVLELADQKVMNFAEAARRAGYSESTSNSLYVAACQLASDVRIREALHEVVVSKMRMAVPMAARAMAELASSPGKDQRAAARDILDRGGLMPVQKIEKHVTHETLLTDVEMVDSIRALCATLGVDASKLIGRRMAKVIDADYQTLYEEQGDADLTQDEPASIRSNETTEAGAQNVNTQTAIEHPLEQPASQEGDESSPISFEGLEDLL